MNIQRVTHANAVLIQRDKKTAYERARVAGVIKLKLQP